MVSPVLRESPPNISYKDTMERVRDFGWRGKCDDENASCRLLCSAAPPLTGVRL